MELQYVCVLFFLCAVSAKLPDYIKPCSSKDPNLNDCALKHGLEAVPHVAKGHKQLGVPPSNPFKLSAIDINTGGVNISLKDITLHGLQDSNIKAVNINPKTNHWTLVDYIPNLVILADYEIKGRILILPVEGKGPMNLTVERSTFTFDFDVKLNDKKGEKYGLVDNEKLKLDIKQAHFRFDNLFNGDQRLGTELNKFLNDNWSDVLNDLGGSISAAVSTVCKTVLQKYFDSAPFKEILLD